MWRLRGSLLCPHTRSLGPGRSPLISVVLSQDSSPFLTWPLLLAKVWAPRGLLLAAHPGGLPAASPSLDHTAWRQQPGQATLVSNTDNNVYGTFELSHMSSVTSSRVSLATLPPSPDRGARAASIPPARPPAGVLLPVPRLAARPCCPLTCPCPSAVWRGRAEKLHVLSKVTTTCFKFTK